MVPFFQYKIAKKLAASISYVIFMISDIGNENHSKEMKCIPIGIDYGNCSYLRKVRKLSKEDRPGWWMGINIPTRGLHLYPGIMPLLRDLNSASKKGVKEQGQLVNAFVNVVFHATPKKLHNKADVGIATKWSNTIKAFFRQVVPFSGL